MQLLPCGNFYNFARFAVTPFDVDFIPDDEAQYIPLVDSHFIKMSGTSADDKPELHKKYLDANPDIKIEVAKQGFMGIDFTEVEEPEESTVLDISLDTEETQDTLLEQALFSPEKDKYERVQFAHTTNKAMEAEFSRYRKAAPRSMNMRSREFRVNRNYDLLENLYRDMIQSVNGFVIDGEPCTLKNKKDWVNAVPLFHKIMVLDKIFSEARVKKA